MLRDLFTAILGQEPEPIRCPESRHLVMFLLYTELAVLERCSCIRVPVQMLRVNKYIGRMARDLVYKVNTVILSGILTDMYNIVSLDRDRFKNYLNRLLHQDYHPLRNLRLLLNAYGAIENFPWSANATTRCHAFLNLLAVNLIKISHRLQMSKANPTLDFSTSFAAASYGPDDEFQSDLRIDVPQSAWFTSMEQIYGKIGREVARSLRRPQLLWYHLPHSASPSDEHREGFERALERMVMGDKYDSRMTAKPEFNPWKKHHKHNFHAFCLPRGCYPGIYKDYRNYDVIPSSGDYW